MESYDVSTGRVFNACVNDRYLICDVSLFALAPSAVCISALNSLSDTLGRVGMNAADPMNTRQKLRLLPFIAEH